MAFQGPYIQTVAIHQDIHQIGSIVMFNELTASGSIVYKNCLLFDP